jgi:hypothetical protein
MSEISRSWTSVISTLRPAGNVLATALATALRSIDEISKSLILRLVHHVGLFPEAPVAAGVVRTVPGHEILKPAAPRFQVVVADLVLSTALTLILDVISRTSSLRPAALGNQVLAAAAPRDVILRTFNLKPAALRFPVVVVALVLSTALALILDVTLKTSSLKPAALRSQVVVAALLLVLSAPLRSMCVVSTFAWVVLA